MKVLFSLISIILATGCASRRLISQGPPQAIDRPALGAVVEAEIGDTIVTRGKIYRRKGVNLRNTIHAQGSTADAGFYSAVSEDSGWIYYANLENLAGSAICVAKTNLTDLRLPAFAPAVTYHWKPQETPIFEFAELEQLVQDAFKQELVYTGRSGNTVKFLYRELFGNSVRVPFAQDIAFDLSDGNLITFKGARFEILESTNNKIKFRLIQTFSK